MAKTTAKKSQEWKYFLSGETPDGGTPYEVRCPYDQEVVGIVHRAGPAELEEATRAAVEAAEAVRKLPAHRRKAILRAVEAGLTARAEEFARILALEAGKPIRLARAEVQRAIFVFAQAAEEAHRLPGETLTLDAAPVGEGRQGIVRRFPVGPMAAMTPFNFPLNLVAHKLAPAMAAGCPVVLKPASQTPMSALALAGLIAESGWPAGALSVLPLASADAAPLVEDERFRLLTFTGSPAVGWDMKRRAGRKRVCLELGGNAGGDRPRRRQPGAGRRPGGRGRLRLRRPELHQRPAGAGPAGRLRPVPEPAAAEGPGAEGGPPPGRGGRPVVPDRPRRKRPGGPVVRRGARPRAPASWWAAASRATWWSPR